MALVIDNEEAQKLIEQIAESTGESQEEVVVRALRDRLAVVGHKRRRRATLEELEAIVEEFQKLPVLDNRSADEIIGYDENGLPT